MMNLGQLLKMDTHYNEIMKIPLVENPIEGIKNAINLFVLGFQLSEAAKEKMITPETLKENIVIYTDNPGTYNKSFSVSTSYTQESLSGNLHNLLISTMGFCAMAVDAAMESFGSRKPFDTDSLNSARNILYQIRCAFAHNPYLPKWEIKDKYKRKYTVEFESVKIEFDGEAILERPNQQLMLKDFGGYEGFVALIKFCQREVERK